MPDAGSTVNLENNDRLSVAIPLQESNQGSAPMENNTGISEGAETFDLGFGDIELHVNGAIFKTHTHVLNDFSGLKHLMDSINYSSTPVSLPAIRVQRDEQGIKDFCNMFKVLYASVIEGPFEFDAPVLISALRISSVYDYPALRAFSITHLEGLPLSAIQRIELAREFQLTSWEGPAYDELYEREEAITVEEARVLGIDSFAEVVKKREEAKAKRERSKARK
ncbi:hypothetical protein BDV93DRAFT_507271 [Ceratobasidium sp. AG-I]|nr:hypothetical protein BDV93DRAFT_507271 [Ceratobasidium sp. AG-I]